eukprot:symbB.v1.2.014058.t1/scaffold1007.1/size144738/3
MLGPSIPAAAAAAEAAGAALGATNPFSDSRRSMAAPPAIMRPGSSGAMPNRRSIPVTMSRTTLPAGSYAICESTDAVPQIIVVEQVASHGLEPGDLEQVQEVPVDTVTATYVEARTISKIKRSLLLEKKLHTDTEIMRGVPVKSTLRNFGRIWRKSPLDMSEQERAKLWDAAVPVEQFDVFLSHTWHTRGIWKWLSLSLQLTWPHILLCGFVACEFSRL